MMIGRHTDKQNFSRSIRQNATRGSVFCLCLLVCLVAWSSCRYPRYEEEMQIKEIPDATWLRDKPIMLNALITSAGQPHALHLYLRHNNQYDYTTLPIAISISHASSWHATSTLSLPLSASTRVWSGQGFALTQHLYRINHTLMLPEPGLYTITISQSSPHDTLRGVESIGAVLSPMD